jgi:uncharacterized phiE125 gp8 family phage protein
MYFPYKEQSRAAVLPVSLAYAKEYLHIDAANTAHDITVTRMLTAARDFFEGTTNNSLTEITWKTFRDKFISCFEIRKTPLIDISSIKYYDDSGILQTIDIANYFIRPMVGYDFIQFKQAFTVPSFSEDFGWPIEIVFKAGYTDQADAIPEDIADALLAHVAKMFENRGDAFEFTAAAVRRFVPRTTKLAILKYKVVEIGA